ncbi:MAG TPA: nitroreductase family protein [Ktedonobacterales bacterium]|nr:nitroreductase family protein [Ktedonobacterales bacterium]
MLRSNALPVSMHQRRTIRAFASDPVPIEPIANAVATAGTAPSVANQQRWCFALGDPARKRRVAEREARENYERRFSPEWLAALAPLGPIGTKSSWRRHPT